MLIHGLTYITITHTHYQYVRNHEHQIKLDHCLFLILFPVRIDDRSARGMAVAYQGGFQTPRNIEDGPNSEIRGK
jgi:hypothetical protein